MDRLSCFLCQPLPSHHLTSEAIGDFDMSVHIPVLLNEVVDGLQVKPGQTIVDATLGGGGHARAILERLGPHGRLIGFDRDPIAVDRASEALPANATVVASNYADIPECLQELKIEKVDGILMDLGLSSDQLADEDRGFSFRSDGILDLRFNPNAGEAAWRVINRLSEKHLADLIYQFGEEKMSRRIARKICRQRHEQAIKTASQLAELVRSCVPRQRKSTIDPATRTFQALRIAVNEELKWLKVAVGRLPGLLNPGGRMAVISFHSLEDRIVKTSFASDDRLRVVTRKPVTGTEEEISSNPRSRSAKLRVAERI